jgi:hypothetical protein
MGRGYPPELPSMREFSQELQAWLTLRDTLLSPNDISDVANRIRIVSKPFYETRDRLQRSREEAQRLSKRLLVDLAALGNQLAETGLRYNAPSESAVNLLPTSGFDRTEFGEHGVTVSIYTPSLTAHVYDCGIMIQLINDGKHRLYAAHRICPHGQPTEVVWSECHEVVSGSSQEEQALNVLIAGLHNSLRLGLEQFVKRVSETRW